MKLKKALKKLNRVDELLSDIADRYAAGDHVVHDFLDSAMAAVANAKETLATAVSDASSKRPPTKAAKTAGSAKKGSAPKRKPNGADSGRQLTRTA